MRLGKGKFRCGHIQLNCLLNIWNIWSILLRKINQCPQRNVFLWTKCHYFERMKNSSWIQGEWLCFGVGHFLVERVHFSQFFYLKEVCHSWYFFYQDLILLKLWWVTLLSVPFLPPRVHSVFLYHTLSLLSATPSFPFFLPLPFLSLSLQTLPAYFLFLWIPLPCTY